MLPRVACRGLSTASAFSPLPPTPLPSPREAHIWYMKPEEINDSSSSLNQYMELLSPSEKRGITSLKGESFQKNAILARTLVRTTLSRYLDGRVDPRSINFNKGAHGKPEIMWQDGDNNKWPLQFSLSHTSSLIACAVALETPIGIDVEENRRKTVNSVMSLARRYFTASEVEYLDAISSPDIQQKEFIRLWTLKEAYVKAIGKGFSGAPFKNFTIKMGSNKRAPKIEIEGASDCEGLIGNCKFALMELNRSHMVAICMAGNQSDDENNLLAIKVWKTIPYIKDEFISESEALEYICGLS